MANPQQTRSRLLDAAERLFFHEGIAVTGVDRVASLAGTSVVTLYKHFGSKENLLREVLARRLEAWKEHWDAALARADSPQERLLAVFDAVESFRAEAGTTQWCCFLATASERPPASPGVQDPVADLLLEDTRMVSDRLTDLARQAHSPEPEALASALLLLYNGVLSSLLRGTPSNPARLARATAQALIAA